MVGCFSQMTGLCCYSDSLLHSYRPFVMSFLFTVISTAETSGSDVIVALKAASPLLVNVTCNSPCERRDITTMACVVTEACVRVTQHACVTPPTPSSLCRPARVHPYLHLLHVGNQTRPSLNHKAPHHS